MKDTKLFLTVVVLASAIALGVFFVMPDADGKLEGANSLVSSATVQENQAVNSEVQNAKPVAVTKKNNASAEKILEENPEVFDRLEAMQQRRPNQEFDPAAVAAAMKRQEAWAPAEEVPEHLPLEEAEFTDGRQFIQLDSLKIETLMPGDNVKIGIDETGQEYQVIVDRIEKHDYNSISWYGHIEGKDGQNYEVSFTRGEKLTVGGLDTPEGHYVLQAHGNDGWVASSALLFKFDTSVDDAIYPPGQEPHDHSHETHQPESVQ